MGRLPGWWYTFRDAFWAGPDYLSGGRKRRYLFLTHADMIWTYGLARRKFTLPAILMLPAAGIITLYALVVLHSPMMPLFFLMLGAAVVTLAAGWFFRPRGELVRIAPTRVRSGETFAFRYEIKSARYIRVFDIVCDPFDWAPHLDCVSRAELACLPARTVSVCEARVRARRRGVIKLYRPIAESSFPFGLVKWSIRGRDAGELVIWPAFTPLEVLALPRAAANRSVGSTASALPGESPDLLGSRDFRAGDAIRHIDWPGSARRGSLVVKEFAREEYMRIAVIADTCPPRRLYSADPEYPELEAAMSLAAAVADNLLRHGTEVDVLAAGRQIHRIRPGRHGSGFQQVCDILAAVGPEKEFPAAQLAQTLLPELHETAAGVLLLLDDTPERRDLAERIAQTGMPVKTVLLTEKPAAEGLPPGWRHIRPSEVLSGSVSSL